MNKISVVLASYNGADYIEMQINSILPQLGADDELIVYDDSSEDSTVDVVKSIADKRIFLIIGKKNVGVNKAFELALHHSTGRFIFFSDQDDIWKSDRVQLMLKAFQRRRVFLVSGCFDFVDRTSNTINVDFNFLNSKESCFYISNILKIFAGRANYYGCAMVIDRDLLSYVLPFPADLESHDLWLALCANVLGGNIHLDDLVLSRRLHGNNLSVVSRSLSSKFKSRVIFAKHLMTIYYRVFKLRYAK